MPELAHETFVELFTRYQNRVYGYVRVLLRNRSDAEEVFQQTVLVLWQKWDQFDADRDFVAWACGIAHLQACNFLRKKDRRHEQLSADVLDALAQTLHESQAWLESRRMALSDCMDKLPPRDRLLLDECYTESAQLRDAAPRLGMSENVLYKTVRKIRRLLLECVDRALAKEAGP